VPRRAQVRAVQLAQAAAQLAHDVQAWASADVLTPSAWARRECERAADREPAQWPRILGPTEEWLLWRDAAQEAARDLPLLDPDALAESLQHASERAHAYGLPTRTAFAGSESELFSRAGHHFAARCRDLNAVAVSTLMPRIAGRGRPEVLLRGFDAIPPELSALTSAQAVSPPSASTPTGVRPADAAGQMEAIASWCCERLRADPSARLLVMFPGPPSERARLAALIGQVLDPGAVLARHGAVDELVGIEGGELFGSLPLPAQALTGLTLLCAGELDVETISRWLIAPGWEGLAAAPRAALARLLRERAPPRLGIRELLGALQLAAPEHRAVARELDGRVSRAAAGLGGARASPRRWAERFDAALAALGWPEVRPADASLQRLRLRWRELLEEFGELAATVGDVRRQPALELLQALAKRATYGSCEEDVPVLISPVLSDPVAIYDGIWVASLSADVLPQPVTPDPFLPLRAQIEAGVPEASAAGRRAQARTLLTAWSMNGRELVLSVPRREKDLEVLPSPCLASLEMREIGRSPLWLPARLHREGCTERLEDARGTTFNTRAPLPGGVRSLTLQSECPFRAYAELRLGTREEERVEPGIRMDQRGNLLHTALQLLWQELRDSQRLAALDEGGLRVLIGECVRAAAASLPTTGERRRKRRAAAGQFDMFTARSPALERECRRAERLIRRLCELERSRPPFTVEATEQVAELALGGARLRLRIDRVDRVASGRAVLDYKSGRPIVPDWLSERPTQLQVLVYLAALGRDVVALANVHLTAREVRFRGVAAAAAVLPQVKALPAGAAADWAAQQRNWIELIERLIAAFLDGDARVDPAPGACDYCPLPDLCRIGAHLSPEPPNTVDETRGRADE
jgi:ATP-dependent helicase/nuclease subunit B